MTTKSNQAAGEIAELSTHDRWGIKGRGTPNWLVSNGLELPERHNRLVVRPDGLVIARLSETEFSFAEFSAECKGTLARLRRALAQTIPAGCYSVPRVDSQVAFELVGDQAMAVLSRVCPADLRARAFGPGDVLQTLCAGVSAQVWNLSRAGQTRWVVFCDSSVVRHQRAALQAATSTVHGGNQ